MSIKHSFAKDTVYQVVPIYRFWMHQIEASKYTFEEDYKKYFDTKVTAEWTKVHASDNGSQS